MSTIGTQLVRAAALIIGLPGVVLFAYDTVEIRPQRERIEAMLAIAHPDDASPPLMIRKLIDANTGSPTEHATRLITSLLYPDERRSHVRDALWSFLLPMHLGETRMYGVYCALSHNGIDRGLSRFAVREYGVTLQQVSPMQAASAVAVTHAPGAYLRNRNRLDQRARLLLQRSGFAR